MFKVHFMNKSLANFDLAPRLRTSGHICKKLISKMDRAPSWVSSYFPTGKVDKKFNYYITIYQSIFILANSLLNLATHLRQSTDRG